MGICGLPTARLLYPRNRYMLPFVQEAGWDLGLVWMGVEKRKALPHRRSIPEPFNPLEVSIPTPLS
jgi:hypothetical protein